MISSEVCVCILCYRYNGVGGGLSVSCNELLNLKCSVVLGGNCSSLYKSGIVACICFQVFMASLCRYVFIGSRCVCSCRNSDGILSSYINLQVYPVDLEIR